MDRQRFDASADQDLDRHQHEHSDPNRHQNDADFPMKTPRSVADPGCSSRIPDPGSWIRIFSIPDPGFFFSGGFFWILNYFIQHCFICRPSDSTVPVNAGIEPRTVSTKALGWLSDAVTTRLDLIHSRKSDDPGCSSRIRILTFYPSLIQGAKRHRIADPGSATLPPSLWFGLV